MLSYSLYRDDRHLLYTVIELLMYFYYEANARTLMLINDKMSAWHQSKCTELTHAHIPQTHKVDIKMSGRTGRHDSSETLRE